jgi:hypothetical protein
MISNGLSPIAHPFQPDSKGHYVDPGLSNDQAGKWGDWRDQAVDTVTCHAYEVGDKLTEAQVAYVGRHVQARWQVVEYERLRRPMRSNRLRIPGDKWLHSAASLELISRQAGQLFEAELYDEAPVAGWRRLDWNSYTAKATARFDQLVARAIRCHPAPGPSSPPLVYVHELALDWKNHVHNIVTIKHTYGALLQQAATSAPTEYAPSPDHSMWWAIWHREPAFWDTAALAIPCARATVAATTLSDKRLPPGFEIIDPSEYAQQVIMQRHLRQAGVEVPENAPLDQRQDADARLTTPADAAAAVSQRGRTQPTGSNVHAGSAGGGVFDGWTSMYPSHPAPHHGQTHDSSVYRGRGGGATERPIEVHFRRMCHASSSSPP